MIASKALTDPRRVYNLDETAFFLSPEVGKVMAKKGAKFGHFVQFGKQLLFSQTEENSVQIIVHNG